MDQRQDAGRAFETETIMTPQKKGAIRQDLWFGYKVWKVAEMNGVTIEEVKAIRREDRRAANRAKRRQVEQAKLQAWRTEMMIKGLL